MCHFYNLQFENFNYNLKDNEYKILTEEEIDILTKNLKYFDSERSQLLLTQPIFNKKIHNFFIKNCDFIIDKNLILEYVKNRLEYFSIDELSTTIFNSFGYSIPEIKEFLLLINNYFSKDQIEQISNKIFSDNLSGNLNINAISSEGFYENLFDQFSDEELKTLDSYLFLSFLKATPSIFQLINLHLISKDYWYQFLTSSNKNLRNEAKLLLGLEITEKEKNEITSLKNWYILYKTNLKNQNPLYTTYVSNVNNNLKPKSNFKLNPTSTYNVQWGYVSNSYTINSSNNFFNFYTINSSSSLKI